MLKIIVDTNERKWIQTDDGPCYPTPKSFRTHMYYKGVRVRYWGKVQMYEATFKDVKEFEDGYEAFLRRVDFKEDLYDVNRRMTVYFKEFDNNPSLVRIRSGYVHVHNPATKTCDYVCSLNHPKWEELLMAKRQKVLDELQTHVVEVEDLLSLKRSIDEIDVLFILAREDF